MPDFKILTDLEVKDAAHNIAMWLSDRFSDNKILTIYPVPRGGIPAFYLVEIALLKLKFQTPEIRITSDITIADVVIDDLIDSGTTKERCLAQNPTANFCALFDKRIESNLKDKWVVFPWENAETSQDDSIVGTLTNRLKSQGIAFTANDNISDHLHNNELDLLQTELGSRVEHMLRGLVIDIDNDPNTKGTSQRIAKMFIREVFKGRYLPVPTITSFPNTKKLDEMYVTGPITIRSACSHHFVPIVGKCWVGIVPGDKVIGLSKFNRIIDWIASRPQIQEELVMQVADYLQEEIQPKGIAVVIKATHMCMTWRGVKESMDAEMTTSVMRGCFRDKPEARAEFLSLVNSSK